MLTFALLAAQLIFNSPLNHVTGDVASLDGVSQGLGNVQVVGNVLDQSALAGCAFGQSFYAKLLGGNVLNGADVTMLPLVWQGGVLTPGTYSIPSVGDATFNGTTILDGMGIAGATFFFSIPNSVRFLPTTRIQLTNGTDACSVIWSVGLFEIDPFAANMRISGHIEGTILSQVNVTLELSNAFVYGQIFSDLNILLSGNVTVVAPPQGSCTSHNSTCQQLVDVCVPRSTTCEQGVNCGIIYISCGQYLNCTDLPCLPGQMCVDNTCVSNPSSTGVLESSSGGSSTGEVPPPFSSSTGGSESGGGSSGASGSSAVGSTGVSSTGAGSTGGTSGETGTGGGDTSMSTNDAIIFGIVIAIVFILLFLILICCMRRR